jgi:hypothetical protein
VKLLSAGLGARLAGFNWNDSVNLSMALNGRGGPGIVLASVAFDAGIINAVFFTTLVVASVLTSQMAGAWLEYVLRSGRPLLSGHEVTSIVETRRRAAIMTAETNQDGAGLSEPEHLALAKSNSQNLRDEDLFGNRQTGRWKWIR